VYDKEGSNDECWVALAGAAALYGALSIRMDRKEQDQYRRSGHSARRSNTLSTRSNWRWRHDRIIRAVYRSDLSKIRSPQNGRSRHIPENMAKPPAPRIATDEEVRALLRHGRVGPKLAALAQRVLDHLVGTYHQGGVDIYSPRAC
jgi:hypothetical protein